MNTHCKSSKLELQGPGRRTLTADFDGGHLTSDAGVLLLKQLDQKFDILKRFAECFVDARDPGRIEHSVEELLRQRIFALALGYEDLNDHDQLRFDPLLATAVGKTDVLGSKRKRTGHHGAALGSRSTLNRLEFALKAEAAENRYCRVAADKGAIEDLFVDLFLDSFEEAPEQIVLDFDHTDNPLHGQQEGRFFSGYYREYCYLPLYVFCGRHLLCAKLRPTSTGTQEESLEVLQYLVERIRNRWSKVEIVFRADGYFSSEPLMTWCEANEVDYVIGYRRNPRVQRELEDVFAEMEAEREKELADADGAVAFQESVRRFKSFQYRTLKSWDRDRRMIGKAELTPKGRNPRFVVTSLDESHDSRMIYEEIYCARGECENRIKEQQLDLFSTRTSGHLIHVNQMRLWFSGLAYVLINTLREKVLQDTDLADARCETIRLKLFKVAAKVRVTVRRIWISMASSYPWQTRYRDIWGKLERLTPRTA